MRPSRSIWAMTLLLLNESRVRLSSSTLSLLGQKPLVGRDFSAGEDSASAEPVALIGWTLADAIRRQPDVLGKSVKANQSSTRSSNHAARHEVPQQ
jgi:hypothetical protein